MSRVIMGLALAVGLAGVVAFGQAGVKPEVVPGTRADAVTRTIPGGRAAARPEAVGGAPYSRGGLGSGLETVRPKRSSEPPDPKAPMVAVRAVLVELTQNEAGKAPEKKPADQPRNAGAPAPQGKPDPAARGKSEPTVIDLDLAAPNETILAELRKLGLLGRLDVLSQVRMTTLDKQPAFVQLGRQEPRITSATVTTFGQTNSVTFVQSGMILSVVPRVVANDVVVLEIELNQSRPGRSEEGTPIFTSAKGETIRQPSILQTRLESTVKVPAGKTVVVAAISESGIRQTETLLLVSARVLNVKAD